MREIRRETLLVFLVVLCVYISCLFLHISVYEARIPGGDTEAAKYLPVSILRTFDLYLDEYVVPGSPPHYSLVSINGHYVPYHPVGNAFLALPFFGLAASFGLNLNAIADPLWRFVAALYTAWGVALLHRTTTVFSWDRRMRVLGITFIAFGTPLLSNASNDFWQQTALFFGHTVLLSRLAKQGRPDRVALAIALALPICRPTGWIAAGIATLWALTERRGWRTILEAGVPIGAVHIVLNMHMIGAVSPFFSSYWNDVFRDSLWGGNIFSNFLGFWFSPMFGVLFFAPVGLVMLWASIRVLRRIGDHGPLIRFSAALFWLHVGCLAAYRVWYGGWSYGPRLMIDLLPFGYLLMARNPPALASRSRSWIVGILLAYSIVVQVTGAVHANGSWHARRHGGFESTSWMWRQSQIPFYLEKWID